MGLAGAEGGVSGTTGAMSLRPAIAGNVFGSYTGQRGVPRRWLASAAASTGIYVVVGLLAIVLGSVTKQVIEKKKIDLTFVEKVVQEPPPPPPPVVEEKPAPPPVAAPVVRPDQKIRKLDKPPPPKELVAPKNMPTAAPKEADPSEDKGVAVYGEGKGDPAGLEGGTAGTVAGAGAVPLPEDADPPLPADANRKPDYPQEARVSGKQGLVVLKVIIRADGTVGGVEVLRGDEPFVSSAVKAVKGWHYTPARYKGQAITVYRIIQIPFKLTA